ncbi:MAG: type II toxin-antitoxin system PemK/MazF family toxin [Sphingomonadales bacterium]|nr:type II toxin-antitoxin system PemK/MazF family toxin [Sphingomonadales bacterium]
MEIRQYQIVLVNLDPTIGREIRKTRPCVVISPNEMNDFLQTVIIAPMTSVIKNYPTRVPVRHNKRNGSIVLDQIRTVDRRRLIKAYKCLTAKEVLVIKSVLQEMFVL